MDEEFNSWLELNHQYFELMSSQISFVIENLLKQNGVEYLSVESRTKSISGIKEKVKRKSYSDPIKQLTDISGIRIILFLEEDVEKVANIINESFSVDTSNSSNNISRLSIDKIGYRSVHFVCDIGEDRAAIKEYSSFDGLKFEIQIRTILQHAWANLTHDRNYKLGTKLPIEIQRKINLYSGMLEIVDLGFSEIVNDISKHQRALLSESVDSFDEQKINSLNLPTYVNKLCENHGLRLGPIYSSNFDDLIDELKLYDVVNLRQIKGLMKPDMFDNMLRFNVKTNIYGFLRDVMIINDYTKLRDMENRGWGFAMEDDEYRNMLPFYRFYLGDSFEKIYTELS